MSKHLRKTLKQDNTPVIALIMFYYKKKSLIFKVMDVVVYCFIENYVCVGYLCIQREEKISSSHKGFEYTSFDQLSGVGTP